MAKKNKKKRVLVKLTKAYQVHPGSKVKKPGTILEVTREKKRDLLKKRIATEVRSK